MKKYYIYKDTEPKKLIKETYVQKDAKRYEKEGFIIRSRTKPNRKNARENINIIR